MLNPGQGRIILVVAATVVASLKGQQQQWLLWCPACRASRWQDPFLHALGCAFTCLPSLFFHTLRNSGKHLIAFLCLNQPDSVFVACNRQSEFSEPFCAHLSPIPQSLFGLQLDIYIVTRYQAGFPSQTPLLSQKSVVKKVRTLNVTGKNGLWNHQNQG